MGFFRSVKSKEKASLIMAVFLFMDQKKFEDLLYAKKKMVVENDDYDDDN